MKKICKVMKKKFACAVNKTKDGYIEISGSFQFEVEEFLCENYKEVIIYLKQIIISKIDEDCIKHIQLKGKK